MIRSLCLSVFLLLQTPSTKEWHGLSPLKSTRADVERVMGKPNINHENKLLTYYLPDVVVSFGFAGNPQCAQKLPYESWDVSAETLTAITVSLKQQVLISDAGIDFTGYAKKKGNSDLIGHYYYSNEEDGFSIEIGPHYIMGYIYEPGAKSNRLRCHLN
jgi:hypothetical protein